MIKNYLANLFRSYNTPVTRLLLVTSFIFVIISYGLIQNLLGSITVRALNKLLIVENFITSSIDNANQVMYGLSLSMVNESIDINNKNITNLIKSFDHKMERHKSIPFYGFTMLDSDDIIIRHTLIPDKLFIPQKATIDLKLLQNAKKNSFELELGAIRLHSKSHEKIIPLCMAIENNKTHIGTICSGLLVDKLAVQLAHHLASKHVSKINLLDIDSIDNRNRVNNSFTFVNILSAYFRDENLVIHEPLNSYPVLLEAEINCYYLSREIWSIIFYCICCFCLLGLTFYCLIIINKRFYLEPFNEVHNKLYEYSDKFIKQMPEFYRSHSYRLCPHHLAQAINHIIDYCAVLHSDFEKNILEKPAIELRNKILHLILAENHYCTSKNNERIESGGLYLNELKRQINLKAKSANLKEFLEEISQYCAEYYNELKITVILAEEDCKEFIFKHTALTEAIFHIFTAITRIGKFNLEAGVILNGSFDNNALPKISIEVLVGDSELQALGWDLGSSYVYSGLLSIYLLAKENNYFFHIEQKDSKIIFLLNPVDDERLQNANELCAKLPGLSIK